MILSSVKPTSRYPYNKDIKAKAEAVNSAMYKYSYSKLRKIFEFKELGFLFKFIYENHPDSLSKTRMTNEKEEEFYSHILNNWMMKFVQKGSYSKN